MGSFQSAIKQRKEALAWARAVDSRIKTFHSSARFKLYLNDLKHSSRLVVIDFFTCWSGVVKFDQIMIRNVAAQFTDVEFIRIEVAGLRELAKEFQVRIMPTFVLWKKGKEVDRVLGAKPAELQKKIEKHRALQA